jgi:CelD/BcsL family acetyltransferase involved in cellulose biosynthesis/glycosyltransferase involved in cell wall biosynthesis
MKFTTLRADQLTADHLRAWSDLQRADPALDSPFFRPEFTRAVAAVRPGVRVAVLEEGGAPAGFFPFQDRGWGIGGPVGGRLCDFQGVVARPGLAWRADELVRACGLLAWDFDHLVASQGAFVPYHYATAGSAFMDLSKGFEAYADERRRTGSRLLRQTQRLALKLGREVGPVRFEPHAADPHVLATLIDWKAAQYRRTGATNVFAFGWTVRLLERAVGERGEAFAGKLSALYAGGRLIAIDLGLRSYGVLHGWFPAYHPGFAQYSPGTILLLEIAKAAEALGLRRYDLGKGPEPYKARFMSGAIPVAEGSVAVAPWCACCGAAGTAPGPGRGPRSCAPPHASRGAGRGRCAAGWRFAEGQGMALKALLCHNYYQQPGGEDQSFAAEAELLAAHGHEVVRFTAHNDAVARMGRLDVARRALWNGPVYAQLRELIRRQRPQVLHCTNAFPLLSPAVYYAARAEGVAVVQSLRNYRLLCPNALFLRDGRVCEDCLGKALPWPGVLHGCYRGSRAASCVVAGMLAGHRLLGTWARAVDLYFTPSAFARQKYIEGGLEGARIAVKPNFVHPDPGPGTGRGGYAVFVGRLSPEKGLATLLRAWELLRAPVALKVVGDGPLAEQVRAASLRDARIEWLGRRAPAEVLALLGEAACLVVPSCWYETFGRTVVEAFARGTPVLASRIGALAELVDEGRTGLLVEPGDAADLAAKAQRLLADGPGLERLRQAARQEYQQRYTAEPNYRMLLAIYERALALAAGRAGKRERISRIADDFLGPRFGGCRDER